MAGWDSVLHPDRMGVYPQHVRELLWTLSIASMASSMGRPSVTRSATSVDMSAFIMWRLGTLFRKMRFGETPQEALRSKPAIQAYVHMRIACPTSSEVALVFAEMNHLKDFIDDMEGSNCQDLSMHLPVRKATLLSWQLSKHIRGVISLTCPISIADGRALQASRGCGRHRVAAHFYADLHEGVCHAHADATHDRQIDAGPARHRS